jgi:hypothetical protein
MVAGHERVLTLGAPPRAGRHREAVWRTPLHQRRCRSRRACSSQRAAGGLPGGRRHLRGARCTGGGRLYRGGGRAARGRSRRAGPDDVVRDVLGRRDLPRAGVEVGGHHHRALARLHRHEVDRRYLSPEQAQGGSVDARADLSSLGWVLVERWVAARGSGRGPTALRWRWPAGTCTSHRSRRRPTTGRSTPAWTRSC